MSALAQPAAAAPSHRAGLAILIATVALAALAGPAIAASEGVLPLALAALPLVLAIALRPELGAWLYLLATPLIVGIARDSIMPLVRPNEALLILILCALGARIVALSLAGRPWRPQLDPIDLALVILATTSSILPLLLRYGRGLPIAADDLLYAIVLWKYYLVYRLFREAVTTPAQVAVCLWLALAAAAMVAMVAILQVLGLFGVAEFLWAYYDIPFAGRTGVVTERGTSTIASSFGVADMMAMTLAVALAWLPAQPRPRRLILIAAGGLFVLGCIAAGQVSGIIGLVVAVLTVAFITGRLRPILGLLVPVAVIGAIVFWSVIETRLTGFEGPSGLPSSWVGRIDNLQRFVWPELSAGVNWVVGVRPAARVPAPEGWREWVFIESGYAWLLWTGGLPMLAAFLGFVGLALHRLARVVRRHGTEPVGVAATAAMAGLMLIATLMLFDPHLTMRGAADLFFPLLALSFMAGRAKGR
jgi:hypothetical protein